MEESDWLTLPDAAQQLGISPRTIRRWIKEGKVRAELRPGPYGQQYYVPATQIHTAQEVHDVVRVDRQIELADLARALDGYLSERESALVAALETLHVTVSQAAQRQEERETALRQEFSAALATAREAQAAQVEAMRVGAEQERQRASVAEQERATWQERARDLAAEVERLRAQPGPERPWWVFWRRSAPRLERG